MLTIIGRVGAKVASFCLYHEKRINHCYNVLWFKSEYIANVIVLEDK
jgi:hypothetical protein